MVMLSNNKVGLAAVTPGATVISSSKHTHSVLLTANRMAEVLPLRLLDGGLSCCLYAASGQREGGFSASV